MVYVMAVLSVLLFIVLIVTYTRSERLQAFTQAKADEALQHAEVYRVKALSSEAQVRDLASRVQDLQEILVDQRAHIDVVQKKAEVETATALKTGEAYGRADAKKRSKSVAHGFTSENFAPLLQDHDWNPKDFRHMGDPIDYLVVPGMSLVHTMGAKADIEEIVLLDIKTGKSKLNTIQRRIRDAVVDGRVRFATYNTDTGQLRHWPPDPEPAQLELPLK